jgi:hypothetical protein
MQSASTRRWTAPAAAGIFLVAALLCQTAIAGAVDPPGLSLKDMDSDERALFQGITEEQFCPCGMDRSFADSLQDPKGCPLATRIGAWLVDKIGKGIPRRRITRALIREVARLNARFDFDTSGAPRLGPAKAPITIVLFSDFECPYCKSVSDPLKKHVRKKGDVALVFLPYPLEMHDNANAAARAALAAHAQGKFWPMHDLLFQHGDALEPAIYETLAAELGLNMKRFKKAMESDKIAKAVKAGRVQGDKAAIQGTPAIYVNGLVVEDPADVADAIKAAREHR